MPPKRLKESITFLVNIGTVRHGSQSNLQLLDKAKFILKHIIQKKIFLRPKDEVGVILMGSDFSTDDSIIKQDNIQELSNMQVGNWDLIESINKLQTTNQSCPWMEAIYAAVEYIKHECVDMSEKKIILLSDFNEEEDIVNQFQVDDIVETLSSEGILLIAIGERALCSIDKDSYTASEALLMNVLQKLNGQYRTYDVAMSEVRFYRQPSTKPMPWHCEMELGDFRIPIIGIAKMPKEPKLPDMQLINKTSCSPDMPDQQVPIKKVAQWSDRNRTIHTQEETIRGYVYGSKTVPVSDDAQKSMTPKTNEKCYRIHGFTARENVPMDYWLSAGTYVIVAADESVSAPFYSLIQAMVEKNVVAIVEKIYRRNTEANMVALFPSVDDPNEPWSLIEIGLPFERDYGAIAQKPLKYLMEKLSKEQSDAMDDLLTSLELPDGADDDVTGDSEKYLPGCMPNPGTQHMWDMLTARANNPDKPLPPIADDVKNLLNRPEFVTEKCMPVAKRMKDLFFLEKKKPLKTRRRRQSENEDNMEFDDRIDAPAMQTVEKEEKTNEKDNSSESKNNASLSNICDFDLDELADI